MSVILCTAGYDHTIRFWEALSGICSRTIQHPDSQVNRLCITPDKRYVAAAGCIHVKLYDIKSSTGAGPVVTFEGHGGNVTGVAFHCEGKWMVTSSEDCTVKVWDTRSGSVQRNYAHKAPVNDVVIHPNQGELISGDGSGGVHVWDLGESRLIHSLYPEEDVSVASVSVASDGSLLCAGNNKGNVYIWRMVQQEDKTSIVPVASFQAHKDYLTRVLLSPDVKHLATCSADHTAKVWSLDPEYAPARATIENTEQNNQAEETEGGSSTVTGAPRGTGLSSSRIVPTNPPAVNGRGSASVTGGGGLAFTGTNGATPLRSNNPFGRVASTSAHDASDSDSDDGEHSENENDEDGSTTSAVPPVAVDPIPMDPASKTLFLETVLSTHQRWVWDCAFSADSAYLVTVCSDHYARLWELASGQIIRQYSGHHRGAVCVALNDYSEPR